MLFLILLISVFAPAQTTQPFKAQELVGAWEMQQPDGTRGLLIMDENFFALTYFKSDEPEFISTEGGKWELTRDGRLALHWEFNTVLPKLVGQQNVLTLTKKGKEMQLASARWQQVDSGKPGALKGAWLITGREQEGNMSSMTPGARKTMKILSGSRFQWIAYNSETAEFFGTGGGSYTTRNGKYTENILFFSRDNSRVGASLVFDYKLEGGKWHHSGNNSKGEPLYEIWSTRQSVGI